MQKVIEEIKRDKERKSERGDGGKLGTQRRWSGMVANEKRWENKGIKDEDFIGPKSAEWKEFEMKGTKRPSKPSRQEIREELNENGNQTCKIPASRWKYLKTEEKNREITIRLISPEHLSSSPGTGDQTWQESW